MGGERQSGPPYLGVSPRRVRVDSLDRLVSRLPGLGLGKSTWHHRSAGGDFLGSELDRQQRRVAAFVDVNRDDVVEGVLLGIEPIFKVLREAGLQVAPSTYYASRTRTASAQSVRDGELRPVRRQLWDDNYRTYDARELWKAARRAGLDVGRDQVARLMPAEGIEGVRMTKRLLAHSARAGRASTPGPGRSRLHRGRAKPAVGDRPGVRADVAGVAYVCFIVDACSRAIVGWRVASHMRTSMVLDAIEMARRSRGTRLEGLRCHSDARSQFKSLRYGERLAEIGAVPSICTVGDSYDNALAETVNGYYKAELVRGPAHAGPWKTVEDLELATLGWVHWHNNQRLHGYLDDQSPTELERAFYAGRRHDQTLVEIQ